MKLSFSSTLLLALVSGTAALTGNSLARCFRDCEYNNSGSGLSDCRSNCRAGENWKQGGRDRDYKNSRRWDDDSVGEDSRAQELSTLLKGMVPLKDKQVLLGQDKDGSGGGGSKNSGDNEKSGSDSKDSGDQNEKSNDSKNDGDDNAKNDRNIDESDDKKGKDDDDDKKGKDDDDDKKRKEDDDDDKKNKDDDDDKKNKDDDDDDGNGNRSIVLPVCEVDGKNFLRCDPATIKVQDQDTCDAIENEVCGKNMAKDDKNYCKCIGLDGNAGKVSAQKKLRGVTMLKGMVPLKDKQVLVGLDGDDSVGSGGDSKDSVDQNEKNDDSKNDGDDNAKNDDASDDKTGKDDDGDDNAKNDDASDDKTGKDDDDDKKGKDDDDDKKGKDDDDDDKKNKDDDDDDTGKRSIVLPVCEVGGSNYHRCDPATMKASDKQTCEAIKEEVCDSNEDPDYCECIGLEEEALVQKKLRGVTMIQVGM